MLLLWSAVSALLQMKRDSCPPKNPTFDPSVQKIRNNFATLSRRIDFNELKLKALPDRFCLSAI